MPTRKEGEREEERSSEKTMVGTEREEE